MAKKQKDDTKKKEYNKARKRIIESLLLSVENINWPMEMVFAKRLLQKHNDVDFWLHLSLSRKFSSLLSLLSQKHLFFSWYSDYKKNQLVFDKQKIELSSQKIGEDIVVSKPMASLLDFVDSQ